LSREREIHSPDEGAVLVPDDELRDGHKTGQREEHPHPRLGRGLGSPVRQLDRPHGTA
jgi:hypothetical protein